jgi:hypothetical protein
LPRGGGQSVDATLRLRLLDRAGEVIAENTYTAMIAGPEFIAAGRPVRVAANDAMRRSPLGESLAASGFDLARDAEGGIRLYADPGAAEWREIIDFAENGGIAWVQDPKSVEALRPWLGDGHLARSNNQGECAHVPGRRSPLLSGLEKYDLTWWAHPRKRPHTYGNHYIEFTEPPPQSFEPLLKQIPPHYYTTNWRVRYPLAMVRVGTGSVVVSTLNFEGSARDPAPARFARNLLEWLMDRVDPD